MYVDTYCIWLSHQYISAIVKRAYNSQESHKNYEIYTSTYIQVYQEGVDGISM